MLPARVPPGIAQRLTAWERFKYVLSGMHRVLMWMGGTLWLAILVVLSTLLLYTSWKFAWWFKKLVDIWFN
jgi:hypothetical protein